MVPDAFGVAQRSEVAERSGEWQDHIVLVGLIPLLHLVVTSQFFVVIYHWFFSLFQVQNIAARVFVHDMHAE